MTAMPPTPGVRNR